MIYLEESKKLSTIHFKMFVFKLSIISVTWLLILEWQNVLVRNPCVIKWILQRKKLNLLKGQLPFLAHSYAHALYFVLLKYFCSHLFCFCPWYHCSGLCQSDLSLFFPVCLKYFTHVFCQILILVPNTQSDFTIKVLTFY